MLWCAGVSIEVLEQALGRGRGALDQLLGVMEAALPADRQLEVPSSGSVAIERELR